MKAGRKKGSVGIIGLGIMGGAFARNLVEAGWRVVGFDVDAGINRKMAKLGVEIAPDVASLARQVPAIITSLPTPKALDVTVSALCAAKLPSRIVIEASTFTLDDKFAAESALKKAGHVPIDCPVSGTGIQAENKDIVFYASGDSKAIAKVKPMFAAFSRGFHDVGPYGNGSKMKYVANLLVAIHNVASAEAMVLGMKAGLDPFQLVDLISNGAGTSRMFEVRAPMMARDRYEPPTMKVKVFQKDMDVIGSYAAKIGVPTPTFSATLPVYAAAMSMGHGMEDTASVCAVLERMAALRRKPRKTKRGKR
jgi:3-hydroxyisobutyrate dehydrogenase-like beta-hydroxyacid dehydrogenase